MWVHAAGWVLFVVLIVASVAIVYQPTGRAGGYRPEGTGHQPGRPPTNPGSASFNGPPGPIIAPVPAEEIDASDDD